MGKQLHICHISILNPAIHSRIFYKMALAQVAAGYKVSIVAQDAAAEPYEREGVTIIPIGTFGRLSWRRIWATRTIAKKAKALQADFYQVHAVELLGLAKKLKSKLPNAKVVWDMHEDYVANILHADYYTEVSRKRLAARVEKVQSDFSAWGDGLILAEECFHGLIDFPEPQTAVVRNKFQAPNAEIPQKEFPLDMPLMVCTGTIAENWGTFRALELWKALNQRQPIALVIAGHAQDPQLIERIKMEVEASGLKDRFLLAGGNAYLPFEEIVGWMRAGDFGLALYDPKENIRDRIPTKFYELMAAHKPVLFTQNPAWDAMNTHLNFGLSLEWPLTKSGLEMIEAKLLSAAGQASWPAIPKTEWSWENEKVTMLSLMDKLNNQKPRDANR